MVTEAANARAEVTGEGARTVAFKGHTFVIEPRLGMVILDAFADMQEATKDMAPVAMRNLLRAVIGADQWRDFVALDADMAELTGFMEDVMEAYETGDESGESSASAS